MIIEKASCQACAEITSAFEGAVAGALLGDFRNKHKLPTRRPKKRSKHIRIGKVGNNDEVPAHEYPAPGVLYKCTPAGIISSMPPEHDTSNQWQFAVIVDDDDMKKFQNQYGQDTIFKFKHVPEQYVRTLAKIAYCYAITIFGIDSFKPLITDLILGNEKNYSYLVGGSMEIEPPVEGAGHLVGTGVEIHLDLQKVLVIVELRLFASTYSPSSGLTQCSLN